MNLKSRIDEELKSAMRAKDQARLRTLRAIKTAFVLASSQKGASRDMDDADALKILQKLAKQRKDSLEIYEREGREDLAAVEREELKIIEAFLPEPISDEELEKTLREIIESTGAREPRDMGRVMGAAATKLAGRADNKRIAAMAKKLLSS
jgi:hypothetical protein